MDSSSTQQPSLTQPPVRGIPDLPLFNIDVRDPEIGLTAYVCIHAYGKYGASGGMRCVPDITREEVCLLARAMTYKYSFFLIEQGGAKAGLKLDYDVDPEQKRLLLQRAAKHLEPLIQKNLWGPWSDINFYHDDRAEFFRSIGRDIGPACNGGSSFRTALSAFATIRASAAFLGIEPQRLRVAIEGFGSVASYLAPMLEACGVQLVAYTTHAFGFAHPDGLDWSQGVARHRDRACSHPAAVGTRIGLEELFDVETDVFIPCARVHSLDENRARRLPTKLVVPIANVPCTEPALKILDARGIPFVPDYVVNGGGVCGHIMGRSTPENLGPALDFLQLFERVVLRMLQAAEHQHGPVRTLAAAVAHRNYPRIVEHAYHRESLGSRLMRRLGSRLPLPSNMRHREIRARSASTIQNLERLFA